MNGIEARETAYYKHCQQVAEFAANWAADRIGSPTWAQLGLGGQGSLTGDVVQSYAIWAALNSIPTPSLPPLAAGDAQPPT